MHPSAQRLDTQRLRRAVPETTRRRIRRFLNQPAAPAARRPTRTPAPGPIAARPKRRPTD